MIERENICKECPFYLHDNKTCEKCACPSSWLFGSELAVCPEGKW